MNVAFVWLLIAAGVGGSTSPTVIAQFSDRQACEAVVSQIEAKSHDKRGMTAIKGVCVVADKMLPDRPK